MPLTRILDHKSPRNGILISIDEENQTMKIKWHYGDEEDLSINDFKHKHYKAPNGRYQRRYRKRDKKT